MSETLAKTRFASSGATIGGASRWDRRAGIATSPDEKRGAFDSPFQLQLEVAPPPPTILVMSAAEIISGLKDMPDAEREQVFADLIANDHWREDLLDLITISQRRGEPTQPIDDVFRDLKIDA
jgi:hypothetical protein